VLVKKLILLRCLHAFALGTEFRHQVTENKNAASSGGSGHGETFAEFICRIEPRGSSHRTLQSVGSP
jgi:hypothetical protein